jgi:hypothetical protein
VRENARVKRTRNRLEKRKREAEARERAQHSSPHPSAQPKSQNEPPEGASGFYFPALLNQTAQASSSLTEQVKMKIPEESKVLSDIITSEIKKIESDGKAKPELKTRVREQVGMETAMSSSDRQDQSEISSDPDWAQSDPLTHETFQTNTPSFITPSFMTQEQQIATMTDATGLTDEEQRLMFLSYQTEPTIEDRNLNFADVVRFGGSSPTPAEIVQMDEDRQAAINLTLQMQMEIDFPTIVPSPEPFVVTLDAEEVGAIPEKELVQIPQTNVNNGNVVLSEEKTELKSNFQKFFQAQHKEQKEEFSISRAHLRKSKKAQKRALKNSKKEIVTR